MLWWIRSICGNQENSLKKKKNWPHSQIKGWAAVLWEVYVNHDFFLSTYWDEKDYSNTIHACHHPPNITFVTTAQHKHTMIWIMDLLQHCFFFVKMRGAPCCLGADKSSELDFVFSFLPCSAIPTVCPPTLRHSWAQFELTQELQPQTVWNVQMCFAQWSLKVTAGCVHCRAWWMSVSVLKRMYRMPDPGATAASLLVPEFMLGSEPSH